MKAFIFVAALLTAAEAVLAKDLVAVEAPADTWCITYLSTYLATVTNQGDLLPSDASGNDGPDAQNSGRLPFAPSLHPTFRRNTSISVTRSAMSTDVRDTLGPESSLSTSVVINTVDTSPVNSESSNLDVDPTAAQSSYGVSTITDGLSTMATSTVDAEATSTSTDIIEPAGRIVIFLIQTTDNEKRAIYRRVISGFIGMDNPSVCTFATTFNLAEGQLFADGVPIYYSGEDYKELSAQGRPPRGSITSGFADSGGTLTFRNSGLPNGEADFCQGADGQVYITFTTGPSGCVPVNLAAYNVEQCQDGRLIDLDDLTSSVSGTAITTADQSLSTPSTFGELPESTDLVPSQSIILSSQTSEFEASATRLSHVIESSTQESGDASSQETSALTAREDLETLSSVSTASGDPASEPTSASMPQLSSETSDLLDSTTTEAETTTAEITTTAELTTTTEAAAEPTPQFACGDPGYDTTYTYNSVTFDLQCARGWSYYPLEDGNAASFGECIRRCAVNTGCNGIVWIRSSLSCILTRGVTAAESDDRWDVAPVASRS
ncbi:hypothetical protein EDB82DRAFT_556961 [Fusarium venenatum]|uniref:uncharacterized protein n=1 Tax=Fusarium venenatum TaxID=56646 RepID=UPI001D8A3243|nr:hypothetical protein EDB82DRAFT_556961 [Fusarium venenatum]